MPDLKGARIRGDVQGPSLADVLADPALLEGASINVVVDLRQQLRHLDAAIEAAVARKLAQVSHPPVGGGLLDIAGAAARLMTTEDSLYRKWKRLRIGYLDQLDGRLKFPVDQLEDYIRRQARIR